MLELDAHPFTFSGLELAAHIDLRRRVVADEHDRERRRPPEPLADTSDAHGELVANLLRDRFAVEDSCRHFELLEVTRDADSRMSFPGRSRHFRV